MRVGVRRPRSTVKRPPISELRLYQQVTDPGADTERGSACLRGENIHDTPSALSTYSLHVMVSLGFGSNVKGG